MSAFISLNGDSTIAQPATLKEENIRQVHDRISVTGVQRRYWYADKVQVTLGWTALTSAQYNQLAAYIFNQGNTITYANSITGINFIGFPTTSQDQFYSGASFLRDLTVVILQA